MKARDFLALVWPAAGYYCIAVPTTNPQGNRVYKHSIHDNMDDAYLDGRARYKTNDIYFGVFTHIADRVMNLKWQKMLPSRKRENMAQAKCLFLDLDVGKGTGKYATQADALSALARFIFRTSFPAPIVVSSGNGLHVYWPLKDPVDASDWKPQAANLRAILDANNVMYDPSRTTDTTSVLRMPSTLNHKDPADLKKVEVLFEGDGEIDNLTFFTLLTLIGGNMTQVYAPAHQGVLPSNIGPGTNFPATDPDDVAAECAQVREVRDKKGVVPESLWYPVVGLLSYCANGRQTAHAWSSGHPNYTPAETEAKMTQWQANSSVPSCAKLNSDGVQGLCQKCPHWGGQFKNPVVIVNKKPVTQAFVAQTTILKALGCPPPVCDPPKPYARTQGLSVTRWDDVKNLTLTTLHEFDLYPISVSSGIVGEHKVNNGVSTWVGREYTISKRVTWRTFEVPNELLSDVRELAKHMTGHGWFIPITVDVAKYMSAYLRELKAHVGLRQQATHLGWPDKDETDRFILNGKAITAQGLVEPCVMAKTTEIATDGMTQGGTLAGQIAALRFFNRRGYEAQQFIILASLGTPLVIATGQHGVAINASGDSAAGKTMTLKAGAAIWGNPAKFIVNGTANGITTHAREARAAALLNLPTFVDEITHMLPEDARAMVMSATQAQLRSTLKSDRTPREPKLPGYRAGTLIMSGNSSLHQTVNSGNNQAGTANSARVLEVQYDKTRQSHTKDEADAAGREFDTHYGWLGEYFMSRAMPSMPMLFDSVERMMQRINHDTNAAGIERFIVAAGAIVFVAGAYASYLGVIDFDIDALYRWYLRTLVPSARMQLSEQSASIACDNILREFISAQVLNTVVYDTTANIAHPLHLRDQIAINHRKGAGEMWISKAVFTEWCRRKGTTVSTLLDELYMLGVVTDKDTRRDMNDGTNFPAGKNRVFVVNANHALIA